MMARYIEVEVTCEPEVYGDAKPFPVRFRLHYFKWRAYENGETRAISFVCMRVRELLQQQSVDIPADIRPQQIHMSVVQPISPKPASS